ncbi:ABC transporter permease [Brevibacillus reuszeri]|uniref:ABC transporter permease n=1 Tax=Brevibacillus reuszeri TaxID=54915 RepID=A0A0K9YMD5_9BACL|nr:ABC transporter permease [Brevibacillus reuszeri]KNB69859.1 ABC transporter permease [Brevibacillus reuszeri]MED1858213.1 ABC transporter permease [Brevibacillus reuszeri]GED68793.1 ABC transporter permease [Brevibacillus reuszeri]
MNVDVDALFRERQKRFFEEVVRYSQYVANGGLLFVVLFLMGLLGLYYRGLVDMIPAWFPMQYFLAFIVAIVVTKSSHRTFLLEADLLFLTPLETKMHSYFQKTQRYNFFIQSIGLFLVLLLFSPLYELGLRTTNGQLWFYWCVPFVIKGWNLYSSWICLRLPDKSRVRQYTLARFAFSFFVLTWVFGEGRLLTYQGIPFAGLLCIVLVVWFHLRLQAIKKKHSLQWYRLLEVEKGLRSRFYRIVNQFKDVPWLQNEVKPRAWLIPVTKLVTYRQANAAKLLFLRTFIRSSGYVGLYIRLILISSFLILILPNLYAKLVIALLFLIMSAIQLKGLSSHHHKRNMYALLPINEQQHKHAFRWIRRVLLATQGTVSLLFILIF